jgi:hypothetical protein
MELLQSLLKKVVVIYCESCLARLRGKRLPPQRFGGVSSRRRKRCLRHAHFNSFIRYNVPAMSSSSGGDAGAVAFDFSTVLGLPSV